MKTLFCFAFLLHLNLCCQSQDLEFDNIDFKNLSFSNGPMSYALSERTNETQLIKKEYCTYIIVNNKAKLNTIDFRKNQNVSLKIGALSLTNKITMEEISTIFPKSYNSKNYGPSSFKPEVDQKATYDFLNIYFKKDRSKILQLIFLDEQLAFADFTYLGD